MLSVKSYQLAYSCPTQILHKTYSNPQETYEWQKRTRYNIGKMLQSYKYTKYHAQTNKYNNATNITIIMHMLITYIKYSAPVNIIHILHKTLKYTI